MAEGESGFTIVPNSVIRDTSLTGPEKLVMLSLYCHHNAELRRAWQGLEVICVEASLSRRCVIDTLKRLEAKGIIRTEKQPGHTTRYEICTRAPDAPVQEMHHTGAGDAPHPCTTCTTPVHDVHPNYTKNNTKELTTELTSRAGAKNAPDPWIADRLGEIRKVVAAPKPGNLPVLLAQWRETYGARTVEQTISKAMRWMQDNGKRYVDMGRFLGRWLARDAERATPRRYTAPDYGDKPKSWRELMPAFYEEEQHDGQ